MQTLAIKKVASALTSLTSGSVLIMRFTRASGKVRFVVVLSVLPDILEQSGKPAQNLCARETVKPNFGVEFVINYSEQPHSFSGETYGHLEP